MSASGSVIELGSRARSAAQQLQAAVTCMAACLQEADGPELGQLLIQIREFGVDPLEAAFATGARRFDRSGEYAADGALSVIAWLKWKCKLSGGAAAERVEIGKQLERLPKTEEAFARGDLGYQHIAVIARPAEDVGRTSARRCAEAPADFCRGGWGAKRDSAAPRPQLITRAGRERLAEIPGAPAGELEGGGTVPAETVQRHACDSALIRITGRT